VAAIEKTFQVISYMRRCEGFVVADGVVIVRGPATLAEICSRSDAATGLRVEQRASLIIYDTNIYKLNKDESIKRNVR
jgi:hypothetical protein|tara:strand:+ start:2268 stop:2501 length:234 start_codon:yes stop_codon:yes gene_type:complete